MESVYLELSELNPDRVVIYNLWVENEDGSQTKHRKLGMLGSDNVQYHKYCGFNKFTRELFDVPGDKWCDFADTIKREYESECESECHDEIPMEIYMVKRLDHFKKWVKSSVCDPDAKYFVSNCDLDFLTDDYVMYRTLDNYATGHIVYINKNDRGTVRVYVYGRTHDVVTDDTDIDDEDISLFNNLIKIYSASEIFIGKSVENAMTKYSGGFGEKFDGNSILLRIGLGYNYVHIGTDVYEFTTDEPIISYASNVGNNCVPYPYAESKNWCYDMSDCIKIPITTCLDRLNRGHVFDCHCDNSVAFDYVSINNRDTDNIRIAASATEETNMRIIPAGTEYYIPNNTSHYSENCANGGI